MSKRVKSCGIVVVCKGKYLICRATKSLDSEGREIWSIPKGQLDEGETTKQCAIREVFEETGLDFSGREDDLSFVCTYNSKKRNLWFYTITVDDIDMDNLKCSTMVDDRNYPEVDKYLLVDREEYVDYIHNHMLQVINFL
jgi:8-oxo-dGTP pyrophosphatase MutT (NUDIX family)